jgi:hypothetical protein
MQSNSSREEEMKTENPLITGDMVAMRRFMFDAPIEMLSDDTLHIKYSCDGVTATATVVRNKKVIRRLKLRREEK